ncbi:histidinol-phosphate transaminase [Frigoribacterium faeni]|uniref:Aromatic amino acid aminotransferase n=1 Tax=Frigoribacterium faeni TaxID=145483 RepID=A0A7W3JKN5_9MICO|nr:histidinol-phosphate transaminase [Frigoribacterium faeni]MBA8814459.1 histidinol-phosphate aminotransferase [Frigoribacterium faeni]BFF16033.1 histidinol-phosphate transaminase [Microbacterium flavescens]GEK84094.1 putative phenylalanine aminotransferase [Frigoribacterium faeni]
MTTPVRLRPEIAALPPYRQGKQASPDAFKLSSNENPFEPLPAVVDALRGAVTVNRYPDATASELRAALAAKYGVTTDEVHVGAGSVSLLLQFIQAAAAPGDEVVYAWRSFEAYPGLVTVAGATSVQVPNRADGSHDLVAMAAAVTERTRLVIVCSPNNPTGTTVTTHDFETFMAAVPDDLLVVLDEAYAEFVTDPDAVDGESLTERHPNLVVLRTFSKAYGLAALRVGYAIGASSVLDAARATAIPLSVTEQGQAAALASLEHESELMTRVDRIAMLRDQVRQALVDQGWDVPAAQGNFVWLPTGEQTATAAGVFADHGIIVRPFAPEGIRITIGEPSSVDKLLHAAQQVRQNTSL